MSKQQRKGSSEEPDAQGASPPPPAYFLSVTVENIRCFGPAQTLDLSDGHGRPARWTVILGDNGTGKTTLLQALEGVEPREVRALRDRSGERRVFSAIEIAKIAKFAGRRFTELRGHAASFELSVRVSYGSKLSELVVGNETNFSITGNDIELQARWNDREQVVGLRCYAYSASRRMAETGVAEKPGDDPRVSFFSDEVALPNAEEWLLQADYAAQRASGAEKKRAARRRDQVVKLLVDLLPDVTEIRYDEPEAPRLVPRVLFRTPYGSVTIDQISLGYRTMIAWTVDLARRLFERYPESPQPLAEPAVVLVDEIDLHLHPKWQREIIAFLSERFPNTQFIVTAHSPLIVQAALEANLAVLRRPEGADHVVVEQDLALLSNLRVDQILTSELYGLQSARPRRLDELLEQRRALLSKGTVTDADRRALEEIEAKIGNLPAGETPEEMEAMDIIQRAAAWLKQNP